MENNAIQIFSYKEQQVRTTKIDGEAWFIAKDVAGILEIQNIRQNLNALDEDEKGVYKAYTPSGKQTMTVISESGLYKLAFKSRKPEAKKFTRWVTHEILPEIYRKGYYAVPPIQAQIEELRQENEMLQAKCNALKAYIQENSSFTMLGQAITPIKGTLSVGEAAKIFAQHNIKIGQNRLYKLLRDMKIVAKRKGRQRNQPTQKSIEQGLCVIIVPFGSKGIPYLTIKGLQKVANILVQQQFPLLSLITGADALHE